ncbi:VOC family protein [Chelatococcus composti]|jgi:Lactoylglutathione lyase and related lyases|uniref:Catechol 2,3-dioxygenase-like lactoylglutathione lyase family enzyme n=1 Tax=Chelatococcus composti TaxID=1743235 RepID=A0A841K9Z3_9HYPH|nr:VOC family protein [Chelatococcus composti]MBB6168262.1 catechol 2,3-dioxygenase-like lactoylglutathione lyase family enzyme [Chelatococcus composti]MBS7736654.1 VOC family protein [Chelatococcus composti]PZN45294.1 MAG: glyoxalase [Pseudomonadota bacterium]
MLSHVTLGTADIERAKRFYDIVLAVLGISCQFDHREEGWVGYAAGPESLPQFWLGRPIDGRPATVGNGVTVAFVAPSRDKVDAFYHAALAAGARDEGAPGLRPHYHPDYYGAYIRDLDGHKICCVCHSPA